MEEGRGREEGRKGGGGGGGVGEEEREGEGLSFKAPLIPFYLIDVNGC